MAVKTPPESRPVSTRVRGGDPCGAEAHSRGSVLCTRFPGSPPPRTPCPSLPECLLCLLTALATTHSPRHLGQRSPVIWGLAGCYVHILVCSQGCKFSLTLHVPLECPKHSGLGPGEWAGVALSRPVGSSRPGWDRKWRGMPGLCCSLRPKDAVGQQTDHHIPD